MKTKIEELREKQIDKEKNQRSKFDKTAKSKDMIIQVKDKKKLKSRWKLKNLKHK